MKQRDTVKAMEKAIQQQIFEHGLGRLDFYKIKDTVAEVPTALY